MGGTRKDVAHQGLAKPVQPALLRDHGCGGRQRRGGRWKWGGRWEGETQSMQASLRSRQKQRSSLARRRRGTEARRQAACERRRPTHPPQPRLPAGPGPAAPPQSPASSSEACPGGPASCASGCCCTCGKSQRSTPGGQQAGRRRWTRHGVCAGGGRRLRRLRMASRLPRHSRPPGQKGSREACLRDRRTASAATASSRSVGGAVVLGWQQTIVRASTLQAAARGQGRRAGCWRSVLGVFWVSVPLRQSFEPAQRQQQGSRVQALSGRRATHPPEPLAAAAHRR